MYKKINFQHIPISNSIFVTQIFIETCTLEYQGFLFKIFIGVISALGQSTVLPWCTVCTCYFVNSIHVCGIRASAEVSSFRERSITTGQAKIKKKTDTFLHMKPGLRVFLVKLSSVSISWHTPCIFADNQPFIVKSQKIL